MIQNERFGTGLKEYLPYAKIIDQTKTSDQYFRLFDVPDKLYVGKNSFRIRVNKDTLVKGSLLYIDVIDSAGGIIYHEITELTGEDGSRLIVVHVYEDTPPGEATIYIAGRASYDVKNRKQLSYSNDPASSIDYIDFPNIFWQGKVVVIPTAETENEIIFAQPPTIRIKERFEEYKTYQSGANRKVELTGSLKVSINPTLTSYDYSDSSKSGTKISENSLQVILDPKTTGVVAESKQVSLSPYSDMPTLYDANGNFTEDFRGGEIVIRNLTSQLNVSGVTVPDFSCSIIEVIDRNNAKIWPPFKYVYGSNNENVFKSIKDATNVTASYYTTKTELTTNDSESFVQLEFDNLEPLAGRVDSVSISYKPYGTFGEFVPIGEFRVKPQEYLIDSSSLVLSKSELIERPIGRPTGSADFDNYWQIIDGKYTAGYDVDTENQFSGQGVLIKSTALSGTDMPYDFKMKLKNGYGIDVVPNTEFKLEFTLGLPFPVSIRESGDLQLDVFISGSSILRDTIQNKDSVKIVDDSSEGERISSLTKKTSGGVTTYTYYFKTLSPGKIYPVFLFKNCLYISIKNISIQPRNELGFSPNQARLFVPLETLKTNTELVFNVEYLNKKKERSKISSQVYGLFFSGSGLGSTIIDNGLDNSPVFQIISSSIGDQAVKVSGSTLYSYNPATSNFSLSNGIFLGSGAGQNATDANFAVIQGYQAGYNASQAEASIFLGYQAGYNAVNSQGSQFIGQYAGFGATNAVNSIFIGAQAGGSAFSASFSNFFGQTAGYAAGQATGSNFFGQTAGYQAINARDSNFLGTRAGYRASSASHSIFIGNNSGFSASNANNSIFMGNNAGYQASAAIESFFLGNSAGYTATSANQSTFIGTEAGQFASSANRSIFIGYRAGRSSTSAYSSNFFGTAAGATATNANNSNFFGQSAGGSATNAANSNFLGNNAGILATNALSSNFLGQYSGYTATNAQYCNFLGEYSGYEATNALHSNFIGSYSGYRATNANNAIFIGFESGRNGINSSGSIFLGYRSGFNTTTAAGSNFIGYEAGYTASAARLSNFIGYQSGYSASQANNSNFFGTEAGYQAINANNAVFIGQYAGKEATRAANSNFIGTFAGYQAGRSQYSNFIGHQAGYQATSASYSQFIGQYAGINATFASNSIFIGNGAGSNSTRAANSNFIGESAGDQATFGVYSNFIGFQAGQVAFSASNSNFIGYIAGQFADFASSSNFIGNAAGNNAERAHSSNFIGTNAGILASAANRSNFIGLGAGSEAISASLSNFIGRDAGNSADNARLSNFIGNNTGVGAINADTSNFIGNNAGYQAAEASDSNFIGDQAGFDAISSSNSNFIGTQAGYSALKSTFANFFGYFSGYDANHAISSTFIGYFSGRQAVSASYSNFIGAGSGRNASSSSYSTYIGYKSGQGSIGIAGELGKSPSYGNIVIGNSISIPYDSFNRLNIGALIFGSGSYFPSDVNSDIIFSGSANGRIGINQPNPQASFDVSGSIRVSQLSTSLTAPPTSGTQKMVITDGNGDLSFKDIPAAGGSGSSSISIIDESTNLGTATYLKFEGAGVTATLTDSTASISIPGGTGSLGVYVIDESTNLGTATYLKFEGAGVTATLSNNTASISIPGGGSGSAFPYTGSASISGSLSVTGSVNVLSGSFGLPIKLVDAGSSYTFSDFDYTIVSSGVPTIYLPTASTGRICVVKNSEKVSVCAVSASGADNIDGNAGYTVTGGSSVMVHALRGSWYIIGKG